MWSQYFPYFPSLLYSGASLRFPLLLGFCGIMSSYSVFTGWLRIWCAHFTACISSSLSFCFQIGLGLDGLLPYLRGCMKCSYSSFLRFSYWVQKVSHPWRLRQCKESHHCRSQKLSSNSWVRRSTRREWLSCLYSLPEENSKG